MKSIHIRTYTKALSKYGGMRPREELSLSAPRLPSNALPCYSSRSRLNIFLLSTPHEDERLGYNGYLGQTQGQMQPAILANPTHLKQKQPNTSQPKLPVSCTEMSIALVNPKTTLDSSHFKKRYLTVHHSHCFMLKTVPC